MRASIISMLIALMIAAGLISRTYSTVCHSANPYIQVLETRSRFKILEKPELETEVCSPEWSSHGTCCRPEDAQRFALYKVKERNDLTTNREKEMAQFEDFLHKIRTQYCEDPNNLLCPKLTETAEKELKAKGAYNNFILQLRPLFSKIHQGFSKVNQIKGKCDSLNLRLKQSSVCSICSGISSKYFAGRQMIVSEGDCRSLISSCLDTWKELDPAVQAAREFAYFFQVFGKKLGIPSKNLTEMIPPRVYMYKWAHQHLKDFIRSCPDGEKCSFSKAAAVCNEVVKFNDPPQNTTDSRSLFSNDLKSALPRSLNQLELSNWNDILKVDHQEDSYLKSSISEVITVSNPDCHCPKAMMTLFGSDKKCTDLLNFHNW